MCNKVAKESAFKALFLLTSMLFFNEQTLANDIATPLLQASDRIEAIYQSIQFKYKQREEAAKDDKLTDDGAASAAESESSEEYDSEVSSSSNSVYQRFMEGEELVIDVSVQDLNLGSLIGVTSARGLRLGLSEFSQVVGFYFDVALMPPSAQGWFFDKQHTFILSQLEDNSLKVMVDDTTVKLDESQYHVTEDIFVELEDLAHWFDLTFEFSQEKVALILKSTQLFPAERRQARESRKLNKGQFDNESKYPVKQSDYQLYSPPMLDIQAAAQVRENHVTSAVGDEKTLTTQSNNYSVLSSHDLAFFNTELFLAGNDVNGLSSARFTLSRQANKTPMLGPLYATEYTLGDVVPVKAVGRPTQSLSRGVTLNNRSPNQLLDNQSVNLVGEVPVGWDVELYRNGVLIDQQLNVQDGRYTFNDTPLVFGDNDFEFLLYGPQGQRQSRTNSYRVDGNTARAQQAVYQMSLVQVGESVLGVDPTDDDPAAQGALLSTVVDYGINDLLAFSFGSAQFMPDEGEVESSYALGLNANFGTVGLLSTQLRWDSLSSQTLGVGFRTRWQATSYDFGITSTSVDEASTGSTLETRMLRAGMTGTLWADGALPIAYDNNWQSSQSDNRNISQSFNNILGLNSQWGYFSHNLSWLKSDVARTSLSLIDTDDVDTLLSGGVQYRKGFGRLHTRIYADYFIRPIHKFRTVGGTFGYYWNNHVNIQLNYDYDLLDDQYQTGLRVNWKHEALELGTKATYYDNGSWYGGVNMRFSLGYDPLGGKLFISGRPLTRSGAIAVRVFEDLNMNETFDEGEPIVPDVRVSAEQAYRHETTDVEGVAVLRHLSNQTLTDISVDSTTLDGPFMITANQGTAIKARKGFIDQVDIPIVKAHEIEGVVYRTEPTGEEVAAPYVTLQLMNKDKEVVATARTEYDGFYLFTDIKPGEYALQVDQNYAFRNGLKTPVQSIALLPEGEAIVGSDFVLFPLDEAAGYIVSAGKFQSPGMLKLYYHLLKKKLGNNFEQMPFFIRGDDGHTFTLSLAYYEGDHSEGNEAKRNAQSACQKLVQRKVSCTVEYRDFKY